MGYDVHITRAPEWSQNEGLEIGADEWIAAVRKDAELDLLGAAEAATDAGDLVRVEDPTLAKWIAHPRGETIWFRLAGGNVVVKNPDEATISKMKQIASRLNGRVQGDEGEFY